MSKITYKLRKNTNGTAGVSISHTHKAHIDPVPFVKATGVTISPNEINLTTGRIIGRKDAAELNQKVQAVLADVEYCINRCAEEKVEPFKKALDAEWGKLQELKKLRETTEPQAKRILGKYLDVLRFELEELKKQVKLKEAEIEEEEIKQNVHVLKLFAYHIDLFLEENKSLRPNSKKNYTGLKEAILLWNPALNITDINKTTLTSFKDWLTFKKETRVIDYQKMKEMKELNPSFDDIIYVKGLRNSSVREILQKMKIVYYFYSDKFNYDITAVKKWKSGIKKLQNDKVVFLTADELKAVTKMTAETDQELVHRDFYVLMANTGLRFVDALKVRKHHIEENQDGLFIKIIQQKTTKAVTIPLTADALRVLEFHNYNLEYDETTGTGVRYTAQVAYFMNRMMERANICSYPLVRTNFKNNEAKEDATKLKRELITSHTARKTFVNISLKNGMDITAIKRIVGHSELNMIMDVYSDGSLNSSEMGKAGWEMPSTSTPTLAPAIKNSKMKVVA